MSTGALISSTALRIPRPVPGIGRYGHSGFAHHIGSFLIHMAIWHLIFRTIHRAPGLIGLVLVVVVLVFLARRLTRRRARGWAPRRW